jgi:hypothetical protein
MRKKIEKVVFIFDDAYKTEYDLAFPLFNTYQVPACTAVVTNFIGGNKAITNEPYCSLDNLLETTNIPIDFDILSIDIDSYDYHIWKSLSKYQPKIVIIEINSSVNTDNNNYIHDSNEYFGTGFKPTFHLGIEKGYTFILHTGNMFFIRNDLFHKLNIHYDNPLENFITKWGGR